MPTLEWNVKNAINRDVERQHLNKILADIRSSVASLEQKSTSSSNITPGTASSIKDIVGQMVENNQEVGISVTYNLTDKVLDFALPNFIITLAGDVTGSATVAGLNSVTITTTVDPSVVGIGDAPVDFNYYWRTNGQWEQVSPNITSLADVTTSGLTSINLADPEAPVWNPRTLVPPAAGITISNPNGVAGNPTFALANDLAAVEGLSGTGLAARTAADTWATRTIQGPDSVVVTNGGGVAGDPSLRLFNDDSTATPLTVYGKDATGTRGWFRPALFESTGVLNGGTLSINGGDNTKFDIAAAIIGSTDYSSNAAAPTRAVVQAGPFTAVTVANLAVIATYVGIQMPGGTVVQQSSPFTAAQRRTIAPLGAVISNGTNLIAVNNLPDIMRSGINQLQDLMAAIGPMNLSGNVISANGANLQINKSAGVVFKQGSNFTNDNNNPHSLSLGVLTGFNFNYRLSTGTQFASTNVIDPDNYESPLGTLTSVTPALRFTIQRITVFTSNLVRIQYGQHVYFTMAEAEASLSTEAFVTEQNISENGILLCFLIVQEGATDLSDDSQAKFIPASKFGGAVGTGGTSITNTDSLPEGSVNLYFTDERAQDAVGTILVDSASVNFTYNDGVPSITADVIPGGVSHNSLAGLQGGTTGEYYHLTSAQHTDLTALAATSTGIAVHTGVGTWAVRSLTAPAAGLTISNNTGVSGNPTFALANDLSALEGLASTGGAYRTGTDTWALRTLTAPAAGLTISNPAGVAGDPTFALANDLLALESLATTGMATRTATDTWAVRTLTGTTNRITVTNGDGVAGNPTFDISSSYVGQTSITTLGTITTGVWNGTIITPAFLGTGSPSTANFLRGDGAWSSTLAGNFALSASTTEARSIEIGTGRTGDGTSFIDLIGDATFTDFGLRVMRNAGANGGVNIASRGTGTLVIQTSEAGSISLRVAATERLAINGTTELVSFPVAGALGGLATGVAINGAAGTARRMAARTDGSVRWEWGANGTAESGSNAGSNYVLNRHDDAGALLATALTVTRSTGVFAFEATPTAAGNTMWHAGNDGAGSGLDADLLDGQHGSFYQNASNINAGVLDETFGGTAQTTYTLGDILYSNAANTLAKLAGNTTTTKQYLSQTGTGTVSAAPAWATIAGADITGAALTKTDDTNVTLTLGGTPTTALLRAASITVGWSGTLAATRGGTGIGSYTAGNYINALNSTTLQQRTPSQVLTDIGGQPLDATLTALAAANWAANALPIGTGADTLSQVSFAANTFPARGSTGDLVAKVITDDALAALAGTDGTGNFLRGDGDLTNTVKGQWNIDNATTASPGMLSTLFGLYIAAPDTTPAFVHLDGFGTSTGLLFRASGGTAASKTALALNAFIGQFQGRGHNGTDYTGEAVSIAFRASEAWTGSANGTFIELRTTLTGQTAAAARWSVNGTGDFVPAANDTYELGSAVLRPSETHTNMLTTYSTVANTGILSPAQITANQDNYAPAGNSTTHTFRLNSDAARSITGLIGGTSGRQIIIANVGSFNISLSHDTTSTAANRFLCPNNLAVAIRPNGWVMCWYDSTSSRWRVMGA